MMYPLQGGALVPGGAVVPADGVAGGPGMGLATPSLRVT